MATTTKQRKPKAPMKCLDPEAPTLDVRGAAHLLALRPSTIRKFVALRQVPFYKLGARIVFDREELLAWRNRHRVAPMGGAT